eukprot:1157700-Pelagomonas_calceolata.AAC.7
MAGVQEGMEAMGQPSPARVRRAIETTCLRVGEGKPEDVLTYGAGLIQDVLTDGAGLIQELASCWPQVDAAYDYLRKSAVVDSPDFRYGEVPYLSWSAALHVTGARQSQPPKALLPTVRSDRMQIISNATVAMSATIAPVVISSKSQKEISDSISLHAEVSVAPSGGSAPAGGLRGIYMREPHETRTPRAYTATITPKLHEVCCVCACARVSYELAKRIPSATLRSRPPCQQIARIRSDWCAAACMCCTQDAPTVDKLGIEQRLVLECSAPWISAPSVILMHCAARAFQVAVDPCSLPPGLHAGHVAAYDAAQRWRGPLMKLPVVVVKPLQQGRQEQEQSDRQLLCSSTHLSQLPDLSKLLPPRMVDCHECIAVWRLYALLSPGFPSFGPGSAQARVPGSTIPPPQPQAADVSAAPEMPASDPPQSQGATGIGAQSSGMLAPVAAVGAGEGIEGACVPGKNVFKGRACARLPAERLSSACAATTAYFPPGNGPIVCACAAFLPQCMLRDRAIVAVLI